MHALVAPAVAAVFLVGACSSHSGKHAAVTTTVGPTTSSSPTRVVRVPRQVAHIPCPTRKPSVPARDASVPPTRQLVPVPGVAVRVCSYGGAAVADAHSLFQFGVSLDRATVVPLQTLTNGLAVAPRSTPPCARPVVPSFLVTFVDQTGRTASVVDEDTCPLATNGSITVIATPAWHAALAKIATEFLGQAIVLPTGAPSPAGGRSTLKGRLASDGVCFWIAPSAGGRTNVIWPRGYRGRSQPPSVLDNAGAVVGQVGDTVTLPGHLEPVTAALVAPIPAAARRCLPAPCPTAGGCTASVWVM